MAQIDDVVDHGLEVLKKSAYIPDDSVKTRYALRTSATGTFRTQGLTIEGRCTEVALNDATWTALPATALSNRNAISIQNQSAIEIKLNYDDTVVGYVGVVVAEGGERHYDIGDDIIIYAKSASGTPTILVEEIA